MKLTLDIKDSNYSTFISFIKTLDYVSIDTDQSIPQWQQDQVINSVNEFKANPDTGMNFNQVMDEIEKDL